MSKQHTTEDIHMNDDSAKKMAAYMKLLRLRRTAIILFLCPPFLLFLFNPDSWEDRGLILFGIGWFACIAGSWLLLIVRDICPWCMHRFFVRGTDVATIFDYCSRTQCANCKEPVNQNKLKGIDSDNPK